MYVKEERVEWGKKETSLNADDGMNKTNGGGERERKNWDRGLWSPQDVPPRDTAVLFPHACESPSR